MKNLIMSFCALLLLLSAAEGYGQKSTIENITTTTKLSPRQFVEQSQDFQKDVLADNYIVLVAFDKIPSKSKLKTLSKSGIQLLSFHSKNTYLAKISTHSKFSDLEKNGIKTIRKYTVGEKLAPAIQFGKMPAWATKSQGTVDVAMMLADNSKELQARFIQKYNIQNIQILRNGYTLIGRIQQSDLTIIAASPLVAHIDAVEPEVKPFNQENRAIQKVNILQSALAGERNLTGAGVTVGVGDGGELGNHIDFEDRVINYANGTYASFGVHGDHVAGIIGGAGNINPIHKGMAPECELVIQKTTSIINNAQTYVTDDNMVMTNNSYGVGYNCESNGTYNYSSNNLDWQSREMPYLLHVFAAGNSGYSTCGNYPTGYKSVLRYYQSAKNVLTVGNVKEDRTVFNGSSKGPVSDGRIKPEICGVGTNVMSTGANFDYFSGTGTSMASPSVVGTLTLLNERYRELHGGAMPKGALMKAIACNTADDIGNAGPDYAAGFGLINGRRAVECIENNRYDTDEISTGENKTFSINVPAGVGELKVMLYWHDVEAAAYATKALINDLDLKVKTPSGTEYLPWVLNHDTLNVTDLAMRQVDTLNNIEQVTFNNPTAGTYTITVSGSSIPTGPQEFFITYDFVTTDLVLTYPYGKESFDLGATQFIQWDTDINNTSDFTIEYSIDGTNWNSIASGVNSSVRHYAWSVPNVTTENGFIKITKEGTSETDENLIPFNILGTPSNLVATPVCESHTDLTWDAIPSVNAYEIYRLSGAEMVAIDTVTTTTYATGSLIVGEEYWYSVRGMTAGGNKTQRAIAIPVVPQTGGGCPWNFDLNLKSIVVNQIGREATSMALSEVESITLDLKNLGINDIDSFEIQYQINNGAIISEIFYETIPTGGTLMKTFSATADFSEAGIYEVNAFAIIEEDVDPTNNEITDLFEVIQIGNEALILPYTEDFESLNIAAYTDATIGVPGIEKWDFYPDNAGELDIVEANSSKCLETSNFSTNSTQQGVTVTLNMNNYVAATDVTLEFEYKYTYPNMMGDGDFLYIRGSDADTWIVVEELSPYAHWVTSDNDISTILANNGQAFSSSFQIHFSQGRNTGYALDNFSLNSLTPLPIELTSFTATKQGDDALLKWETSTEINNEKFEIEVAQSPLPLTDENFKRIGTVLGNGTTTTNHHYTFLDNQPLKSGLRYYRLKQINTDGTYTNTEVRAVDFGTPTEVAVFPNPFSKAINVRYLQNGMHLTHVQLINTTGNVVFETYEVGQQEDIILNIQDRIPDGMYFLRLIGEQETLTYPILKSEK